MIYEFKRTGSGREFLRNGETLPKRITKHSPTGWDWGGGGSGCLDLAANVLMDYLISIKYTHPTEFTTRYSANFKYDFIEPMAYEGGEITGEQILAWFNRKNDNAVVESNPIEEKSVECVMCGERTHFKCDKAGWDVIWQMYQHAAYYCTDCFDEAKAEGVV